MRHSYSSFFIFSQRWKSGAALPSWRVLQFVVEGAFSLSASSIHAEHFVSLCLSFIYMNGFAAEISAKVVTFFFFCPREEKMNCMSVCTDNGWKTNRICFGGVFIYAFSELDVKVPFKTPQAHQLLCFKWRLKFSTFQESHSKGWNFIIPIDPSAGAGFIRIPWSPSQRWRNRGRDFCRGAYQRAMANPSA